MEGQPKEHFMLLDVKLLYNLQPQKSESSDFRFASPGLWGSVCGDFVVMGTT